MGNIFVPGGAGNEPTLTGEMFAGKAATTSATADTAYLLLNAEQIPEFFALVVDGQNIMSQDSRLINVKGQELDIANVNFADGKFVGGLGSTTRMGASDESVPVFGGVKLNPQPFEKRMELETTRLPNWNVAGAGLEPLLEQLMATCYYNDLEDAFIQSDTAGADPAGYGTGSMTTIDGWITQAVANCHVYDHGAGYVRPALFENLLAQLPVKWRYNAAARAKLCFYVPSDVESTYHYWLTNRATALGDMMLTKDGVLTYKGVPIVGVPKMSVDAEGILTRADYAESGGMSYVLLCEPSNKLIGYNPEMRVFKHPRDDGKSMYINLYGEYDCGFLNEDAVAVAANVTPTIDPSITALA